MPAAEHHHQLVVFDEVLDGIAELVVGGLKVGALGGDGASIPQGNVLVEKWNFLCFF